MNEEKYSELETDVKKILWVVIALTFFYLLCIGLFFKLLIDKDYHAALEIIPILTSSVFFMVLWQMWGRSIGFHKRTWFSSFIGFVSAGFNVALNFFLIPLLGLFGAAVSTLVSYCAMAVLGYVVSRFILKSFTVSFFGLTPLIICNFLNVLFFENIVF